MNVFELFAKLGLDTSEYDKGLEGAEKSASGFGDSLKKGLGVAAGVATTAVAATTAATIAGTKAFIDGVSNVAAYGDNIEKTSQKLGLGVEKFQEWDYVMNIAGTSMNNMSMGVKTMTNQLDAAKNGSADALAKFEALGLSLEDLQSMTREEVFEAAIYGFQGMADSTERAALANDLFGRSGQELTPLFNMTQAETKELIATANEYGMVMSEDAVKASATFQDSLTTLQNTMSGLKNNMLSQFLPAFSTVMDGLSAVFSGDSEGGLAMIEKGVGDLADKIASVAPEFIRIGGTILTSLASSIAKNAPTLIEAGAQAVSELITGIVDNADSIIEAAERVISTFTEKLIDPERAAHLAQTAVNLVAKLATGISEALPELLPAIVSVVVEIVRVLTAPDNLSMLIQCSLQLVIAIANGIVEALPELVSVIPTVIFNLVDAIVDNFPEILNTTLYLLGALGYAILDALSSFLAQVLLELTTRLSDMFNKAYEFGQKIGSWLREKIQSGKNAVQNFFSNVGNFFTNGFNNIKNKVQTGLDNIKNKFTSIFDNVKNTVKNAIDFIKGLFNFQWSLPKIKLPHFSISGQLDLFATPPTFPSVSIEWYKKAMNNAYMLDGATIFGAANGKLLGGGESGSELVVGTDKLMNMIKQATGANNRPITINVYGAEGQDVRLLAKEVSRELQNLINDKEKVYA